MTTLTAFTVVIPEQGIPFAVLQAPDWADASRPPDVVDVRRACLEITADLNSQAAAQYMKSLLEPAPESQPSDIVRSALEKRTGEGE